MSIQNLTTGTPAAHRAADPQDQALKERHQAMWASGDYPTVSDRLIPELGERLVRASGIREGNHVLDVAAGTGNAALPAAATGARVVASDLTPALLEAGRRQALRRGLDVEWQQADAEALPYPDATFDAVISCVGVMFAPDHQACADELVRVCRPGGTIGLLSWTPAGFLGQMLATVKPFLPPPPAHARPAPLWGDPEHVAALFADRVQDVRARREVLRVEMFPTAEAFRDFFATKYGPVVVARKGVADDPERSAALDRALEELAAAHDLSADGDPLLMEWEYLLLTARRSA